MSTWLIYRTDEYAALHGELLDFLLDQDPSVNIALGHQCAALTYREDPGVAYLVYVRPQSVFADVRDEGNDFSPEVADTVIGQIETDIDQSVRSVLRQSGLSEWVTSEGAIEMELDDYPALLFTRFEADLP